MPSRGELTAAAFELVNRAQAFYLLAVRDLGQRPGAVAGARPGKVAKTFLEQRLRRSKAATDVAATHALDLLCELARPGLTVHTRLDDVLAATLALAAATG